MEQSVTVRFYGDPGSGKTLLLDYLARLLREDKESNIITADDDDGTYFTISKSEILALVQGG